MLTLKNLSLDRKFPRIAVVITDQESNESLISKGIDVLEIRVDLFQNLDLQHIQENIKQRQHTQLPLILTIRTDTAEGAQPNNGISEDFKMQILKDSMEYIDAVDIELTSPLLKQTIELAHQHSKRIIISSHNFNHTPSEEALELIFQKAKEYNADIVKIAAQANALEDVCVLTAFTMKHAKDDIITMSLGEKGKISRLVFPAMGSLLTYSFLGKPSAPGQIPLKKLQEHLKIYY